MSWHIYSKMHQPFRNGKAPFVFNFDDQTFYVAFRNDPVAADDDDTQVFDMLMDSLAERNIEKLGIEWNPFSGTQTLILSPDALDRFMVGNRQLKELRLDSIKINDALCDVIGRKTHCLDTLQLSNCELDMQLFAEALGANKCGPRAITLESCLSRSGWGGGVALNFSSINVPLLSNASTEYRCLDLRRFQFSNTNNNDCLIINAAFKSNEGLQHLILAYGRNTRFVNGFEVRELQWPCQWMAEAPMLRTVELGFSFSFSIESRHQGCEMFAKALKDCQKSSLEKVKSHTLFDNINHFDHDDFWKREVVPILRFNRNWRLFQENEEGYSPEKQYVRALSLFAGNTDNCHFRYWLVREHAGHLRRGKSEQASPES
jgi:hypothetical protein